MTVKCTEVDPSAAWSRLQAEPGAVYLDVRTEAEYEAGHPDGAWNIPVVQPGFMGMSPNPRFAEVAAAVLPKDTTVFVGCKSGQRSQLACEMLEQLGFTKLVHVAGGFHGQREPSGRVVVAGWLERGLPSTAEPTPGRTWAELSRR